MENVNKEKPLEKWQDVCSLFTKAFPTFKCFVCEKYQVLVLEDFENHRRTKLGLYNADNPEPTGYFDTLSFECGDCGYVHQFTESGLRKKYNSSLLKEFKNESE